MRKLRKVLLLTSYLIYLFPVFTLAAQNVEIKISAEKEVTIQENGKSVIKRAPAKEIMPEDVLFYTINYNNITTNPATDVVINDPIPAGTTYILGSAYGEGASIEFSVDQGETFKLPSTLTYEFRQADGKIVKRRAIPEDYTHIRWVVGTVAPGKSGVLGFQVRVK